MDYILGLDLGASSLGWAVVEARQLKSGRLKPTALIDAGVRIFEAGVEGEIEKGKDSSRAAQRREARQPRRQHWRRQHRKRKLFERLQSCGLLPPSDSSDSADRKKALDELDARLAEKHLTEGDHLGHQKLTYILRARAATEPVEPYELGRALYHLAQRRGFLSNRKGQDDDEESGKVKPAINELENAIENAGSSTLGEFYSAKVDVFRPHVDADGERIQTQGRIRKRFTHRNMYQDEFRQIREAQERTFEQTLTKQDWDDLYNIIFYQRPLKSQKHLIGRCSLEPNRPRCAEALPIFQRFRILQQVNHLRLIDETGTVRELDPDQRKTLTQRLAKSRTMSLKSVRKALKLPPTTLFKHGDWEVDESETKLTGHTTNHSMRRILGDRWDEFSDEQQEQITTDVLHFVKPQALVKRARKQWKLDHEQAVALSKLRLEEGYSSLSKQAIARLTAAMQKSGITYTEAREQEYPESFRNERKVEYLLQVTVPRSSKRDHKLPPNASKKRVNREKRRQKYVSDQRARAWDLEINNPAVIRALTELRKVVNAVVRKYGKPAKIRIELLREIKQSRDARKDAWKRNQAQEKRRKQAAAEILKECDHENPTRADINKWLLGQECNWTCPYCGKSISPCDLFGSAPSAEVEHIYPVQYLDDSFGNKTLACNHCNKKKGNRTPWEAFGHTDKWEGILQRVSDFKGPDATRKRKRFEATEIEDGFTERHLNDSRYNTRLAKDYLGTLFGGWYEEKEDGTTVQRVEAPTGTLTWMLRTGWQLDGILNEDGIKQRKDQRHHAIDAIVVALSDQAQINAVAKTAEEAEGRYNRSRIYLKGLKDPWAGFTANVREVVNCMNVSYRETHSIAGSLHDETNYANRQVDQSGKREDRVRKPLGRLSKSNIKNEDIVDDRVRAAVEMKLKELGTDDPKQAWGDIDEIEKFPILRRKDGTGSGSRIYRVRIREKGSARRIAEGVRARLVKTKPNYAAMVYALLDDEGNETKWDFEIIDRFTAYKRLAENRGNSTTKGKDRILIPDEKAGTRRFKFSLRRNDMLLLRGPTGHDIFYRVSSMSESDDSKEIQLIEHVRTSLDETDDRGRVIKRNKYRNKWNRIRTADTLRERDARKVDVTPIGGIFHLTTN